MPHRARTRSAEVASGSQRVYHSSGSPAAARNSGSSLNRRRGSGSSSRSQQSSGQSSRRSPSRARFPGSSLVTPATELVSDDASPRGGSSSVGNSRIRRREEDAANTDGGGGADDDNEHEGCDAAMKRMMKKLKTMRPEELAKLSKAASEMEKSKLEDKQKVAEFVGKTPELADLVDDCYICMEPLLNNIGTSKFGVLSWHCRCTVAQKAHSSCLLAKICRGDKCDMCSSPMMFESPRGTRNEATIKLFRKKKKSAHSARSARSARSSLDQDETSMFSGESSGPESFISADESGQDEQEDDGEGQEQEHEAEEEEEEELELELDDREEAEREEEPGEVEEEQEEQEQEEEEQEEAVPVYPNMNVYGEYVAARMRAVLEGSQERRAGGRYGEIDEVHDQPWFQQVRGVPREGEVRRGGRGRRR